MVAIPKGFVRVPCLDDARAKKRMNYDLFVEDYQNKYYTCQNFYMYLP